MKAQGEVEEGLNVTVPLMVLCSGKSYVKRGGVNEKSDVGVLEDFLCADVMTDSALTIAMVPKIARKGKIQLVNGAVHDVFLSSEEVREKAYEFVWEFFGEILNS